MKANLAEGGALRCLTSVLVMTYWGQASQELALTSRCPNRRQMFSSANLRTAEKGDRDKRQVIL